MSIPRTTLEQWRVLQAIVEHGGFAQAAEALHRSQSSVSYMVARLREQVGVELLVLEGRKARLTDAGQALLAAANELLRDASRLERLAASLGQGWEPEVRMAVDVAFPTGLLVQALARYTDLAAQTRVQLKEVVLSGAEEALLTHTADLVIGTRVPVGHLGDLLLDVEFVALAHPAHALHRLGRELTTEDLARELQVVLRDSGTQHPRDEGWLGARQRWTVTAMQTSLSMVASGLGFAWLPRHLAQRHIDEGSVLPLPLREGGRRRVPLYLMYGATEPGPATRRLAEVITEEVAADTHRYR
ncbi:Transcriptional regulator, LysR family [plant metagenome]|uniref:Transcriptional regulator, LysR family n=1 Tax=plant metagenome TaxID=1297885 RepID=A0A484R7L7_9ZZZZ